MEGEKHEGILPTGTVSQAPQSRKTYFTRVKGLMAGHSRTDA